MTEIYVRAKIVNVNKGLKTKHMNDKIITALLAILIALGGWTLSRTFSLSQDMVLVKEKISQVEKQLDEAVWNTIPEPQKKKKKKKKKNKKKD